MFSSAVTAAASPRSAGNEPAHAVAKPPEQRAVPRVSPPSGIASSPRPNDLTTTSSPSSSARVGTSGDARKRARSNLVASGAPADYDDAVAQGNKRHNSGEVAQIMSKPDSMGNAPVTKVQQSSDAAVLSNAHEKHTEIGENEVDGLDALTSDVCDLGIGANEAAKPSRVPLIPSNQQAVPNWQDGLLSGFGQPDHLNMDLDNENWLLEGIDDILNHDTQYLQLQEEHEPDQQLLLNPVSANSIHAATPATVTSSDPTVASNMPAAESIQQTPNLGPPDRQTHSSASNQIDVPNATRFEPAPSKATTLKQTVPPSIKSAPPFVGSWSQGMPNPTRDMYGDVRAPDIETRIITQPHQARPPPPGSTAIRIAPRDQLKPEAGRTESSRQKSGLKPKLGRQTATQLNRAPVSVKPNEPSIQRAPFLAASPTALQKSIAGGVPYPPNFQMAPALTMPAAMPAGRNISSMPPGSMPVPHPMAAPLLFAQGFPPITNPNQHAPFLVPSASASPSSSQRLDVQSVGIEQRVQFIPGPNSSPVPTKPFPVNPSRGVSGPTPSMHFPPNAFVPPMMAPGMAHMNQATLMRMAQHLWYAAMTASNNSPTVGAYTDPGRLHYGVPAFMNPSQPVAGAPAPRPNVTVPGVPASPVNQNHNLASSSTAVPGKGRPIYITDDGKHVVVEQQAPAKLMKHPVLGRLQLQSRQHAATESNGNGAGTSYSIKRKGEKSGPRDGNISVEGPTGSSSKERRKRLVWTPELHDRFVQAISSIGLNQAVPKTLVQIMNVEGLTTEHVKSHLQKYRNSLRKASNEEECGNGKPVRRPILNTNIEIPRGGVRIVPSPAGTVSNGEPRKAQPDATRPSGAEAIGQRPKELSARTEPPLRPDTMLAMGSVAAAESAGDKQTGAKADETPASGTDGNKGSNVGQGDIDTRVVMQERTMGLQFQLQVMVHRTVALQKKLQLMIEKQSQPKLRETQMATSASGGGAGNVSVDSSQTADGVADIEVMKQELDRQSAMVRDEIGMMQKELGKSGDDETTAALTAANKMKQELDRQADIVRHEIGMIQERLGKAGETKSAMQFATATVANASSKDDR